MSRHGPASPSKSSIIIRPEVSRLTTSSFRSDSVQYQPWDILKFDSEAFSVASAISGG